MAASWHKDEITAGRAQVAATLPGAGRSGAGRAFSQAPRSRPHKTRGDIEQCVVTLRRQLPTFSVPRLRRDFQLPVSPATGYRLWHVHGLVARQRRKYQRKQDLAVVKATFRQISYDTKDLVDIPRYWPRVQARGLPRVQYTAREVRTGLQFVAIAWPVEQRKACRWRAADGGTRHTRPGWREVYLQHRLRQGRGELERAWLVVNWPAGEAAPYYYVPAHFRQPPRRARCLSLSRSRWRTDQYFQCAKDELGLDHFEGRSWRGLSYILNSSGTNRNASFARTKLLKCRNHLTPCAFRRGERYECHVYFSA
jgi:hypothetical protein